VNELALFAGAGGGILGGHLLGWRTVCAVEIEDYPRRVLLARQRDGILPRFPIWDDIKTFDGNPWRGRVDVVSGGFPCQDISAAGKGAGIRGERSGMWAEMARVVSEVRPRYVFVENSPMLTSRGLGVVLGDLSTMGYDARWGVLGARHVKAPHKRDRIWIVAYSRHMSRGDGPSQIKRNGPRLMTVVKHINSIPTPKARDWKDSTQKSSITAVNKGHEMTLGRWVHHYPTPQASDNRDRGHLGMPAIKRRLKKGKQLTLGMSVSDTSGALNPSWVEWLMGWPLFWTTLDMNLKPYYDAWYETQQWIQTSSKKIQNGIMRNVWWKVDPAETPQRWESMQQQQGQRDDCMSTMPHEDSLHLGELGSGKCKASSMQDLRGDIQAKENSEIEAMWQAGMPKGERQIISRTSVGEKKRADKLKAIGNGQVPAVAALAWQLLTQE